MCAHKAMIPAMLVLGFAQWGYGDDVRAVLAKKPASRSDPAFPRASHRRGSAFFGLR